LIGGDAMIEVGAGCFERSFAGLDADRNEAMKAVGLSARAPNLTACSAWANRHSHACEEACAHEHANIHAHVV
jgi:hypothetical protein